MSDDPIIRFKNLTKFYGQSRGIEALDFTVEKGGVFGFLGPNGAGKTTTIRLMLDLLRPSSGTCEIFGKEVGGNSFDIRQRCGYLPGDFAAYGNLSGEEFLNFIARLRGAEASLSEELRQRLKLSEDNLSKKIKYLSHGMRQKIGIMQAFQHAPELLILDEPTIGLDPLMQEAFYDLVRDRKRKGDTIFFSSHNLPEVEKVCDRVAIIREGRLVALETLAALRRKRFRKLIVTLEQEQDDLRLKDTELLTRDGPEYTFLVKGAVAPLIEELATLPVADVVFPEPELEEVFMAYYEEEEG